jgi:hypothetical protein
VTACLYAEIYFMQLKCAPILLTRKAQSQFVDVRRFVAETTLDFRSLASPKSG